MGTTTLKETCGYCGGTGNGFFTEGTPESGPYAIPCDVCHGTGERVFESAEATFIILGTTRDVLDGRKRQGMTHEVTVRVRVNDHAVPGPAKFIEALRGFYGMTFDPSEDKFEGIVFNTHTGDTFYYTRSEVEDYVALDLKAYERYMKSADRLVGDDLTDPAEWTPRR